MRIKKSILSGVRLKFPEATVEIPAWSGLRRRSLLGLWSRGLVVVGSGTAVG